MDKIYLEGIVGWDFDARDVRNQLAGKGDATIYVSSPGGSVFDGFDIYNVIKEHAGNITVQIGAMAFSTASWLVMAANKIEVFENSSMMIHRVSGFAYGDANEMRKAAELAEGLEEMILDEYEKRMDNSRDEIREMLNAETWFLGGKKIIESGLADAMIDGVPQGSGDEPEQTNIENRAVYSAKLEQALNKAHELDNKKEFQNKAEKILSFVNEKKAKFNTRQTPDRTIQKEKHMDLETLKNEHPAVLAEVMNAGVSQERDRVAEWLEFQDVDADMVANAINEGRTMTNAERTKLIRKATENQTNKTELQNLEGESAPEAGTDEPGNAGEDLKPENKSPLDELKNQLVENLKKRGGK